MSVQSASSAMSAASVSASGAPDQELYDCSGLLQYAADCETAFTEQYLNEEEVLSFGHPDPPRLHMFDLSDDSGKKCIISDSDSDTRTTTTIPRSSPVWMIAYTSHTVAGQLLFPVSDAAQQLVLTTSPMDVATLRPLSHADSDDDDDNGDRYLKAINNTDIKEDEIITCLTVLALEQMEMDAAATRLSDAGDRHGLVRLVVALGTNNSRLLSSEIVLDRDVWTMQRPSDHLSNSLYEVLPRDGPLAGAAGSSSFLSKHSKSSPSFSAPFAPSGGVTSLSTFRMATERSGDSPEHTNSVAFVWIAYRDGTLVRLHHAGLFPSVWKRGADEGRSIEDIVRGPGIGRGQQALVRCKVHLPATLEAGLQVQPLARYFPSPLAPLWKATTVKAADKSVSGTVAMDEQVLTSPDISSDEDMDPEPDEKEDAHTHEGYEALVFGSGADTDADQFPTLCFYTSEDHLLDRVKRDPKGFNFNVGGGPLPAVAIPSLGAVVGGTKALVGGVFGSALRWGFGGLAASAAVDIEEETADEEDGADAMEESVEEQRASAPFPSLWRRPIALFAGSELHDMPRKVESCSVDPDGLLAAVTDGLGRVLLIDLSSKQVVRLWKGFRDASCYWIQAPSQSASYGSGGSEKLAVFLVIHSRQRRVVEVFHARHGSRLCSVQVGRDAQVVPCSLGVHMSCASCYLVHSNVPGTSFNQTEKIKVDGLESLGTSESRRRKAAAKVPSTPSSRDASLRFQHLQQLLSTTNVQCRSEDVYTALQQITSFTDLAAGLDLLAGASVLEQKMQVEGSDFQKRAVAHCKECLEKTTKGNENEARSNPNVQLLTRKIEYHSQVCYCIPQLVDLCFDSIIALT
jgi:hypothetical protein